MSETIITRLARMGEVVVIARNASFKYKAKAVGIQQVGEEVGASYVLEGSVQKAGGNVRIHAQLIETATDRHVWAEQYDRKLKDVRSPGEAPTLGLSWARAMGNLTIAEEGRIVEGGESLTGPLSG